jgi:hypothetical protein
MGVRPPTATQTGDILLYLQAQGQRRPTSD